VSRDGDFPEASLCNSRRTYPALLYLAMELRSRKAVPSGVRDDSTSSDSNETSTSEDAASEKGLAGEEEAEVPEYERQRQERIQRNEEKLAELGIQMLAGALRTSTVPTSAAGGEGSRKVPKATRNPCASTLAKCQNRVEYLNPKP
jgi:hypothetical protein